MLRLSLKDEEYPASIIDHDRIIARAVVINQNNEVAILHVVRDDIFGFYDYFELPGGGVKENEPLEEAVIREIHEEIGAFCFIIQKLGIVDDYYNLIKRHNINHYYLLKVDHMGVRELEEYEKIMIHEVEWMSIDSAIEKFKSMPSSGVSKLVMNRELPILLEARKYLNL